MIKERSEKKQIDRKRSERINKKQSARNIETLGLSVVLGLVLGIIVGGLGGGIAYFIFGFGFGLKSAALFGFCLVFIGTIVIVWILSLFE